MAHGYKTMAERILAGKVSPAVAETVLREEHRAVDRPIRRAVWVVTGATVADHKCLTPPQAEALVILLAVLDRSVHIGKRNDLRAGQVNSQAFRVLREHGLACHEYETFAGETHVYATCTDKALLDAMEHTPWLTTKVRAAEALLAQQKAG